MIGTIAQKRGLKLTGIILFSLILVFGCYWFMFFNPPMIKKLQKSAGNIPLPGKENALIVKSGTILPFQTFDHSLPEERGAAALVIGKDAFYLYVFFEDSYISNTADRHNDMLFGLGDTLEFFLQPSGRTDYYELQLAPPDGFTLQLHILCLDALRKLPLEEKVFESGMITKVVVNREENWWYAKMIIPYKGLNMTREQAEGSRFAVARYNYSWNEERQRLSNPELSMTVYFEKLMRDGFHRPKDWHIITK